MPTILDEQDVRRHLPMSDLIPAMADAVAAFSKGEVDQPLRTVLQVGPQHAFFGVMPAYVPSLPALGTKLVTVFASNAGKGLPTHLATIALLDPETGALMALLDGRYITEARTAAVSAVSVQHLARHNASVLAILGAGVQARSHLEAIGLVRRLSAVKVWSRTSAGVDTFIREMQPHHETPLTRAASPEDAVRDADIIVLVTAATTPVVRSEWVRDGSHICAVGACRPNHREMDSALVARSTLIVDSRVGALAEAGDLVIPIQEGTVDESHIRAELGEVVSGREAGRTSDAQVTVFKSLGMAVEDVAAAHLAWTRAAARMHI